MRWNGPKQSCFTVKTDFVNYKHRSARHFLALEVHLESKDSLQGSLFFMVGWKEACLTQDNLERWGFQLRSKCFLCGVALESISRLFLHCSVTKQLWQLFLIIVGLSGSCQRLLISY